MYIKGKAVDLDDPTKGIRSVKIMAQNPKSRKIISSVYTNDQGRFNLNLPVSAFETEKEGEYMIYLSATNFNYFPPEITLCAKKDDNNQLKPEYPESQDELIITLKKWNKRLHRKFYAYGTLVAIFFLILVTGLLYYFLILSPKDNYDRTYRMLWTTLDTGFDEIKSSFEEFKQTEASLDEKTYQHHQMIINSFPGGNADTAQIRKWKELFKNGSIFSEIKDSFTNFEKNSIDNSVNYLIHITRSFENKLSTKNTIKPDSIKFAIATHTLNHLMSSLKDIKRDESVGYFRDMINNNERFHSILIDTTMNKLSWRIQREMLSSFRLPEIERSIIQNKISTIDGRLENFFEISELSREKFLKLFADRNRYWHHVVFWALLGACLGLLWATQRTIFDRNFDHGHWPRYVFRLLGSPIMASVFILLSNFIGFTGQTFVGIDPSHASKQISLQLACPIAFLCGMFTERLYQRLRSIANLIFKSDYKI